MPGLDWSHPAVDDVLSFGTSILMILFMAGIAVWLARSITENIVKTGRWIRRSNHDAALLRENERLRDSLADAQEENDYLRRLYRNLPPRAEEDGGTKRRMISRGKRGRSVRQSPARRIGARRGP